MKRKHTSPSRSDSPFRVAAEAKLAERRHTAASAPAGASPEELVHELQVHQIELEMQNDELQRAQLALEESRDRYVDLYELAPVGYLTLNHEALIAEANLTVADLLGEDRQKLLLRRFARFVAPADRDAWDRRFSGMMREEVQHSCEVALQRADGTSLHARLHCRRITAGGRPSLRIALTDVTELKQAEEELRIAAIAFESSQEAMVVTDAKGIAIRVNRAFSRLTGYSAAEAVGQTPAFLRSDEEDGAYYERLWATLADTKYWQGELWNRRKNGQTYAGWLTISAVTDREGHITHYVGSCSDVTERRAAAAEIHRLAYHDALTDLPNRRLLQDRLGQALASAARGGNCGALLFLDLDDFKLLNDTYGHDAGDLVLRATAQRLRDTVRSCDTVARLGGDEFVVMLVGLSSEVEKAAVEAARAAENIRNALARHHDLEGQAFRGTTSIGVALFRGDEQVADLLRQADLAMYEAKKGGRDALRFFDPGMQAGLVRRNALVAELREALERQELQLYYQPQLDRAGRVIGAETLLRWVHTERGLISPREFIPLAEESAVIVPIGRWVLMTAFTQLEAWRGAAQTRGLRLAVNVSACEFHQPDFVEQVQAVLRQTGADPAGMHIELTERLVTQHAADTLEKMTALKGLGIGFSMHGFGAGQASLSHLTRLPFDQIKIDMSVVQHLDLNEGRMVQTIIATAENLGVHAIAERVETEAQREFLDRQHCPAFQGYLYSRPLPREEFERYLEDHARPWAC